MAAEKGMVKGKGGLPIGASDRLLLVPERVLDGPLERHCLPPNEGASDGPKISGTDRESTISDAED